jgi:hypothetical protein
MVSAVAPGAVVNTDLLPRRLPFLPSERGDESLKPPPALHRAGFLIESGAPRSMKVSTIASPRRYEGAADYALWRVNTHRCFRICYVTSA